MTFEEFQDLVKEMRKLQIEYFFNGRNRRVLEKAKKLENLVDFHLGIKTEKPKKQLKLF